MFTLFLVTLLCCSTQTLVSGSNDYINMIVDEVILTASQYLQEYKLQEIPLPDINATYNNLTIDGFVYNGYMVGQKGTLKDATTLKRFGDAEIDLIGDDLMVIMLNVTFDKLFIHEDVFNAKIWVGSTEGGADIQVSDNQFYVKVTFQYNHDVCRITIDEAKAIRLGGFDFHLLPPSIPNYIKNKVFNAFMNGHPGLGIYTVNSVFKTDLQNELDNLDLCSYLHFIKEFITVHKDKLMI